MAKSNPNDIIEAHYAAQMPDDVKAYLAVALADLYNGPSSADELREQGLPVIGFEGACKTISAWWYDAIDREVWLDTDSDCVCTSEPDPYWTDEDTGETVENDLSEYRHYSARDTKSVVFGALADYI